MLAQRKTLFCDFKNLFFNLHPVKFTFLLYSCESLTIYIQHVNISMIKIQKLSLSQKTTLCNILVPKTHPFPNSWQQSVPHSYNFVFSRITCKWNHIICKLFNLGSIVQSNIFEIHVVMHTQQQFDPFHSIVWLCHDLSIPHLADIRVISSLGLL